MTRAAFFTTCADELNLNSSTAPSDVSDLVARPSDWNDRIRRRLMPSQSELAERFFYNAGTGMLIFKPRPGNPAFNSQFAGKPAGYKDKRGYWQIAINKNTYWCHRLIWKLVYGVDPREIDHINGDKSDNRISNLRDVDRSANNKNIHRMPASGRVGVHFAKKEKRWVAQIRVQNKTRHLGNFVTKSEAIAARQGAEKALGYYDI